MNEKRPVLITIICIAGFIGAGWVAVVLFTPAARQLPSWYRIALIISTVWGLVNMTGLWKMKRWGLYSHVLLFLAGNILLYYRGIWQIGNIVIPIIGIVVALCYFKKLS